MKNSLKDGICYQTKNLSMPSLFSSEEVDEASKLIIQLDPEANSSNNVFKYTIGEMVAVKNKKLTIKFLKNNPIEYKTNSLQLRSDELDHKSIKDNFVFSGCSFTYGEGLPLDLVWGKLLNEDLNKSADSKYFSISYRGGSIDYIINALEDLLENYGSPKAIFALFPSPFRRIYEYDSKLNRFEMALPPSFVEDNSELILSKYIKKVWPDHPSKEKIYKHSLNLISELNSICIDKNVPFFWGTWDYRFQDYLKNKKLKINNYVDMSLERLKTKEDPITEKNKVYYYQARDTYHPGAAYHSAVKNLFKEAYENYKSTD